MTNSAILPNRTLSIGQAVIFAAIVNDYHTA